MFRNGLFIVRSREDVLLALLSNNVTRFPPRALHPILIELRTGRCAHSHFPQEYGGWGGASKSSQLLSFSTGVAVTNDADRLEIFFFFF